MELKNILAIGAHPDDIELGCGGTIIKNRENNVIYGLIITKGQNGKHCPKLNELDNAMNILGVKDYFVLKQKDGGVKYSNGLIDEIEKYIKKLKINTIFTHTINDRHQDHHYTALASIAAGRNIANLISYESPSTNNTFNPNIFVTIENTLEKKIEALNSYHTQIKKGIVDLERVKCQANYWGFKGTGTYTEAFEAVHIRM